MFTDSVVVDFKISKFMSIIGLKNDNELDQRANVKIKMISPPFQNHSLLLRCVSWWRSPMQWQWIQSAVGVCFSLYLHVTVKALKIAPASAPTLPCINKPGRSLRASTSLLGWTLFTADTNVSVQSVCMFQPACVCVWERETDGEQ